MAEEVTGAEEAWVAEAGAAEAGVAEALSVEAGVAEAGVAEAGATEALSAEAGVAEAGATEVGGVIDALFVEAGAGVADGLSMATVTGVVARTVISGPTAGVVFPTAATDTARQS